MKLGIVCDSTCDLPLDYYRDNDVRMVPLKVRFGEDVADDWTDLHPEEFFRRLASSPVLSKTSQPSPAEFEAEYRQLAEEGCDGVVSVHLSAAVSGTFESATLAAASSPIPVEVLDTKKVSHGTGLVLKACVEARDQGGGMQEVTARARAVIGETRMFFILDTLDYLVKGGRAGKAQGLAAALLNIKPILTFDEDGVVAPFKKVKGFHRAIEELARHIAQDAGDRAVVLAYLHACAPERVEELRTAIREAGASVAEEDTGLVGAVIGTYAGPGATGCAYHFLD